MRLVEAFLSSIYTSKLSHAVMTCLYIYIWWDLFPKVNVGGIKIFFAQFQTPKLRKEMLNAAHIYLN